MPSLARRRSNLVPPGLLALVLAAGCAAAGAAPTQGRSMATPGFWEHWGDGRAEVAGYRLTRPRYGELRSGESILITVTEDFAPGPMVKSDGGHGDAFPVLKLNRVEDFQTGIYDYNAMTSVFLPLDGSVARGGPAKLAFSMQEWCGSVYEHWIQRGREWTWTSHSYFDGEADQERVGSVPPGAVVEDAWPLLIRGVVGELLKPGEERVVPWLPGAMERRLGHRPLEWTEAKIARSELGPLSHAGGELPGHAWTVVVGSARQTWWVEAAPPRRILGWEASDGTRAELTGAIRSAYWQEKREGDEVLRESLGLPARIWPR